MRISDARRGLRVTLTPKVAVRFKDPYSASWRVAGSLTSGRVLRQRPGYEEGLYVRVKWDTMPTPESWSLMDLALTDQ